MNRSSGYVRGKAERPPTPRRDGTGVEGLKTIYNNTLLLFVLKEEPVSYGGEAIGVVKGVHVFTSFAVSRENRFRCEIDYIDRCACCKERRSE